MQLSECAVEIQKELKTRNAELPESRRMEFRIGVNLGDVIEDGERILGDGVNIAARLESLSEAGGVCIYGTAYDFVGKKLPLGYEYLGEHSVKNIEKAVRVYRVLTEPEQAGKVIGEERLKPKYSPDKPSIAVLPFDNLSGDSEQDYYADGIVEDIITVRSKFRGNANACTGSKGSRDAKKVSSLIAKRLGINENLVFPSSTGVIGSPLPMKKIEERIPELMDYLSPEGWMNTVEAIMTTDTFPKIEAATCRLKGKQVKLCGMVKGAGMIRPNLATMLSFLVTDANIKAFLLQRMLEKASEVSYNRLTIDGETSTNDTVLLLANGKADHPILYRMDREGEVFQSMLFEVCQNLAKNLR